MTRPPVRFTTTPTTLPPLVIVFLWHRGAVRRPIQNRILAHTWIPMDAREYKTLNVDMLQHVAAEYYATLLLSSCTGDNTSP